MLFHSFPIILFWHCLDSTVHNARYLLNTLKAFIPGNVGYCAETFFPASQLLFDKCPNVHKGISKPFFSFPLFVCAICCHWFIVRINYFAVNTPFSLWQMHIYRWRYSRRIQPATKACLGPKIEKNCGTFSVGQSVS